MIPAILPSGFVFGAVEEYLLIILMAIAALIVGWLVGQLIKEVRRTGRKP